MTPATITGPSTTQSPYIVPRDSSVTTVSLLSSGETVAGATRPDGSIWRFAGVPDGIGAYANADGSVTVLVNHEIASAAGPAHATGPSGAFVDALTIDPNTLEVTAARDLGTALYLYDTATEGWTLSQAALSRLCSADLPAVSAFYDAASGLGTTARILLTGEEAGPEGRAFAWIASGVTMGEIWELPRLGNYSFENILASPDSGERTVAIAQDDSTPGQLYLYAGTKQAAGTEIDKAGLTNGQLYGIQADFLDEVQSGQSLNGSFRLTQIGDTSGTSGADLQTYSEAVGVTEWLRPEDGAWDTVDANRYYFVTTNSINQPSRLWALDFFDVKHPEWGGKYTALLDGTEGQRMLDNLAVSASGKLVLQEDPGNFAGAAKIWQYDPATDTLSILAQHDPARFGDTDRAATAPFTQDEESSGVVEVTDLFTHQPGQQVYLLDTQAHYPFGATGSADRQEIVEGGQLQLMYVGGNTGLVGNGQLAGARQELPVEMVDWDAIAAAVLQRHAETGTWW